MPNQTAAYSHKSNGVAEPYNQTLFAIVRPVIEHAPPLLCTEAYNWACYIKIDSLILLLMESSHLRLAIMPNHPSHTFDLSIPNVVLI